MGARLRAARLDSDRARLELIGEPRDDLVLHVEEVGDRLVEALGPKVRADFGLDQLHVDAHPVAAALDAAFEHVAHIESRPICLRSGDFLCRKRR